MLTESFGRAITENHSGRDKQVPAVKDCRFTQTAFGTVVHDSSGKWLGQYETEDAAVEMLREWQRTMEDIAMKYDGYQVGIVIKSLRIQRNLQKKVLQRSLALVSQLSKV